VSAAALSTSAAAAPRIRVAHVVTRFIAGAGGVVLRAVLGLDRNRFEPVIMTAPEGPLIEQASAAGIEVLTLRHMRSDLATLDGYAGVRELTALFDVGRFQIVHTHSAKAGALGRIAAWRVGVPALVHTFHGFPFHDFQAPLRRAAYIAAERRLGRITDRLVAVSSSTAADAVRLRIATPDQVRVIPVSISEAPAPGRSGRSQARRLLGVPQDATVIGTVGRLDRQKAPHHFLEAVAALPAGVIGVWIGDGPLRPAVEIRRRSLGLERRVLLLGEREDVADLLPGLDAFVLTSLYEGLPCALVEAMRARLPVVATAVNGVPELIVPGETGLLIPPARPAACARAVTHLLHHPREAARMAETARRSVSGRFTPAAAAAALTALYLELLEPAGAPAEQLRRAS
jgi:glycosyltransferase involved in cell wall biosynthesis